MSSKQRSTSSSLTAEANVHMTFIIVTQRNDDDMQEPSWHIYMCPCVFARRSSRRVIVNYGCRSLVTNYYVHSWCWMPTSSHISWRYACGMPHNRVFTKPCGGGEWGHIELDLFFFCSSILIKNDIFAEVSHAENATGSDAILYSVSFGLMIAFCHSFPFLNEICAGVGRAPASYSYPRRIQQMRNYIPARGCRNRLNIVSKLFRGAIFYWKTLRELD